MSMWKVYRCDVCGNDEVGYKVNDVTPTGQEIDGDTSKKQLCKILGLADPYKLDLDHSNKGVIFANYDGIPAYEFREVK